MKKQIELEAIKQQLEYTIEEVHKKRSDKNLMHDWLTDALSRVKKLTMTHIIKSVCDDCTAYPFDERGKTPLCKTCKDNPSQTVL